MTSSQGTYMDRSRWRTVAPAALRTAACLGVVLAALAPRGAPAASAPPTAVLGWAPGTSSGVPPAGALTVYFNRPMDRSSVLAAWKLSPTAPGRLTVDGAQATFQPYGALRSGTAYQLTIRAGARSTGGSPLARPFTVRFSTGDRLRVTSYSPYNGTQGVPPAGVIAVTFNHPMVSLAGLDVTDRRPAGWRVTITPHLDGYGSWLGTSTWSFHPRFGLRPSTRYTVTLAGSVHDQWGQALGAGLRWSFRTIIPEVYGYRPGGNSKYVDPRTAPRVIFDQHMDHGSTDRAFTVRGAGVAVPGSLQWRDNTVKFQPRTWLMAGRWYTASVSTTARAVTGQAHLKRALRWSFRVAPAPRLVWTEPGQNGSVYQSPSYTFGYGQRFVGGTNFQSGYYQAGFHFTAPLDKASLDRALTITPRIDRFDTAVSGPDQSGYFGYIVYGDFKPSSTYVLSLAAGVRDAFNRPFPAAYRLTFHTARMYPSVALYGPPGAEGSVSVDAGKVTAVPVQLLNVPSVTYTLLRTSLRSIAAMCCGAVQPDGRVIRTWTVRRPPPLNTVHNGMARLVGASGAPLAPGLYWLAASTPDSMPGLPPADSSPSSSEIILVRNLSVTMKSDSHTFLVWATSAATGEPAAGAEVRLLDYAGKTILSARTDVHGLHLFHANNSNIMNAVVSTGTQYGMARNFWSPSLTQFNTLPWDSGYQGPGSNGTYLYTDRPVYRPGQIVHFRGVLWRDQDAVYSFLGGKKADVWANDSTGKVIYRGTAYLDRYGAVHGSFATPAHMPTGGANIAVNIPGVSSTNAGFTVAEYRKPEFLATIIADRARYATHQTVNARVSVQYVFGQPVTHGLVTWTAYAQPQAIPPPGWDQYTFFDYETLWQQYGILTATPATSQFGTPIGHGTGRTDGAGELLIHLPVKPGAAPLNENVTIEATATDVNHQSVSARTQVATYTSDLAIGLAPQGDLVPAGKPTTVDIATVHQDGAPAPAQSITVTVSRRLYSTRLVQTNNGQSAWQPVPSDTPLQTTTVVTDSQGKGSVTFTPPSGGDYAVRAQGKDSLGNTSTITQVIVANGPGFTDWGASDDTTLKLQADATTYKVGDTAHILVASPFDHATALITVERGTIRSYRVTRFTTNAPTVDVPVTLQDLPNVYVTVTLYHGRTATTPPGWRYGTVELHVHTDPKHVVVHLAQQAAHRHPGDPVTYTVTTTDAAGHPESAQISLALVDTAVLALQDELNPDILQALYAERPLGVSTASDGAISIDGLTSQPTFKVASSQNGAVYGASFGPIHAGAQSAAGPVPKTGGGGPGVAPTINVRSQFADTAFWAGAVVTDGSGHATVRLRLPDNATTWRLDARAVTTSHAVGQDALTTLASQDLIVRPAAPRFFLEGDSLRLGAALNNTLNRSVTAQVSLAATGLRLRTAAATTLTVPAHGVRFVSWPVQVLNGTAVALTITARPTDTTVRGDAVRLVLPVHTPLTDETTATTGQVYGSTRQYVLVPHNAVSNPGALTVQVSSSLVAGLGAAYGAFHPDVNESNEDTSNRVLAAASLHSIPAAIAGVTPAVYRGLPATVYSGVQRLLSREFYDGGWPWFTDPYVTQSDPTITADVLQALAASGLHGPGVQAALKRGNAFLATQLAIVSPQQRAHLLYVMALSRDAVRSQSQALYDNSVRRLHLDTAPLGDLGLALQLSRDSSRSRSIVSVLDSKAVVSATGAHWESSAPDMWSQSAISTTGEVLSALLRLSPHDPSVPAAARWLMAARYDAGWGAAPDTAQAIAALAAYARAAHEGTADYQYSVTVGARAALQGRYTPHAQSTVATARIPIAQLHRAGLNSVVVARRPENGAFGPGPLYYLARLHYYLPARDIAARSEGISIGRQYFDLHGRPITSVAAGSAVRVRLTIHAEHALLYLNVEDPFPMGLEPIDDSLNTAQRGLFGPQRFDYFGSDLASYLTHVDLHDDRASLYAYYLPPGTFTYSYLLDATVSGTFGVAPAHVSETFFPEVFGRSAGADFTVR